MGQRGPLPKPTSARAREGNPRRRPLPTDEPSPAEIAIDRLPPPPDHLTADAKQVFSALAKLLSDSKLLTVADVLPIELLADCYTQWIKALKIRAEAGVITQMLNRDGEVIGSCESAESKLCRSLAADCNRWFKVLGLGPAYRVGLRMTTDGADEIEDPLAASIANG